jgi:hypothetical protein
MPGVWAGSAADTTLREGEEARATYAALLAPGARAGRGNGLASHSIGTAMSLTVSPYLDRPTRPIRDTIMDLIAAREAQLSRCNLDPAERWRIEGELAFLSDEQARIADWE